MSDIPAPVGHLASCSASCTRARISSDGRVPAVFTHAHLVRLWDISDPAHPVAVGPTLTLGTRYDAALASSPDGRTLATADDEHAVQLWDITEPERPAVLARLTGDLGGNPLDFSPDGRLPATVGDDHGIRLWNVEDRGRPRPAGELLGHTNNVVSVAFSPDSRALADQTVRLWDVGTSAPLGPVLIRHTRSVSTVAFSPDGQTPASGSTDHTVRLWNLADRAHPVPAGEPMTELTSRGDGLVFSPEGGFLAVAMTPTSCA